MSSHPFDIAVVGGGIVGLASTRALVDRFPRLRIVVLEKESELGRHQTGRNSGVIHSGVYYKPGSFKARLCRAGNASMLQFCKENGVAHDQCGKLIVATTPTEIPRLEHLHARAHENELDAVLLSPAEIREHEPHVVGARGLWVPSTGITDYNAVLATLAHLNESAGVTIRLGSEVGDIAWRHDRHNIETSHGRVEARYLVNCGGLHSDRIAARAGASTSARIVPFRGEYFELVDHRRALVRGLVYPVPDPNFPFLGVHFTRMIDGSVHAGPNAVLALSREGYRKRDVRIRDMAEIASFPGFWRLARRHGRAGMAEVSRSISKRLFLRSLQRLVPDLELGDLIPSQAGVRAQLLERTGELVDDFRFVHGEHALHVCNAPSPAATASLEIGRLVADRLADTM